MSSHFDVRVVVRRQARAAGRRTSVVDSRVQSNDNLLADDSLVEQKRRIEAARLREVSSTGW